MWMLSCFAERCPRIRVWLTPKIQCPTHSARGLAATIALPYAWGASRCCVVMGQGARGPRASALEREARARATTNLHILVSMPLLVWGPRLLRASSLLSKPPPSLRAGFQTQCYSQVCGFLRRSLAGHATCADGSARFVAQVRSRAHVHSDQSSVGARASATLGAGPALPQSRRVSSATASATTARAPCVAFSGGLAGQSWRGQGGSALHVGPAGPCAQGPANGPAHSVATATFQQVMLRPD